ncbi:Uncharacterised protein [Mycobacteroides abscessus subsp. abscessus]|nr:Uncharacterised protein [Mycobacteroides abscessus subsp. abscessus]
MEIHIDLMPEFGNTLHVDTDTLAQPRGRSLSVNNVFGSQRLRVPILFQIHVDVVFVGIHGRNLGPVTHFGHT